MVRKAKYPLMGKAVTVRAVLKRASEEYKTGHKRTWRRVPLKEGRAAWVVGYRTLYGGTYYRGFEAGESYLQIEETFSVVMVAFWPTMRPVPTVAEDLVEGGTPYPPAYQWSDKDRANMRKWSKDLPRDARGRFCRGGHGA